MRRFYDVWRDLMAGAFKAGETRRDVDPAIATQALLGNLIWTGEWYRPGGKSPETIAAELVGIAFEGIARSPRPRRRALTAS